MSEFLKKLKEAVDSGKQNDMIKAGFEEIVAKAEKNAADPSAMKQLNEKYEKLREEEGNENQKKLTPEDVTKLNELAKKAQDEMLEREQQMLVLSAVISITNEIEIIEREIEERKNLILSYKGRIDILRGEQPYKVKKELIDLSIDEFNRRAK
jgi:hypothetical protein